MVTFHFTLKYCVPSCSLTLDEIDDRLFEAGFDDAIIGHNGFGQLSLDLTRQSNNAWDCVLTAHQAIEKALPSIKLIEAKPDYVGVTDIANYFDVSRQYIQKLISNNTLKTQPITVVGNTAVYHSYPVILALKELIPLANPTHEELTAATMELNLSLTQNLVLNCGTS